MRRVSIGYYQQQNDLPAIKQLRLEYKEIHTHVLQDVLRRLDKAFHAFFRRVATGQKPGYPRFQQRHRYHSLTYAAYGNGVKLDGGLLWLSKIGRMPLRLHRPLEGTRQYDAIYYEDLRIANLTKAPEPKPDPDHPGQYLPNGAKAGLNKSILDAGREQCGVW